MGNMFRLIILAVLQFLFVLHHTVVAGLPVQKCDPVDLITPDKNICPYNASCNSVTKTCECIKGHVLKNNSCVVDESTKFSSHSSPDAPSLVETSGNGHVVAAVLVPLFLISLIVLVAYFGRKYRMFSWMRSKFFQRNSNYDEFMIGQDPDDDDPPLR